MSFPACGLTTVSCRSRTVFFNIFGVTRWLGYFAMKEARKLDVVLHSATGLKKVSASKMSVYAVAWIEPSVRVPSPMHLKAHGTNPVWNTTISMSLDLRTLGHGMYLNIELLGHGLVSTRRIGFVSVNLSDIFLEGSKGAAVYSQFHALPVRRPSGRQQGFLNFVVHLHESLNLLAIQEMIPRKENIPQSLTVAPPTKPQEFAPRHHQPDGIISPSSSSEEGGEFQKVPTRNRVYALRPKSFTSLLSCH